MQLAEALKAAKGLTTLDLGGNSMGPKGIAGMPTSESQICRILQVGCCCGRMHLCMCC